MIKKSLRAYITRRQFVFFILLDSEMLRVFFFQTFKHEVNGVLKILVVLTGFRRIYHFKQRRKILFLVGCFVPDVTDKRGVVELFGL